MTASHKYSDRIPTRSQRPPRHQAGSMIRARASDNSVNIGSFMLICIWISIPAVASVTGFGTVAALFAIWTLTSNWPRLADAVMDNATFLLWYGLMILLLATGNWQYGKVPAQYFMLSSLMFSAGAILFLYYGMGGQSEVLRRGCTITIWGFAVGAAYSAYLLAGVPMASRVLATTSPEAVIYSQLGIGGYGHVYAAPILMAIVLQLISNDVKSRRWAAALRNSLAYVALLAFVVMSAYATALIFAVLVSVFSAARFKTSFRLLLAQLIACIIALVYIERIGSLLVAVADRLPGSMASGEKLVDLSQGFTGGSLGDQTQGRLDLYAASWQALIDSPLWGGSAPGSSSTIGGHSAWLDMLGSFGILVSLPFFLFLLGNFRRARRARGDQGNRVIVQIAWTYVLLLGFVNPVVTAKEIGFALLLTLPSAAFLCNLRPDGQRTEPGEGSCSLLGGEGRE